MQLQIFNQLNIAVWKKKEPENPAKNDHIWFVVIL